MFINPFLSLYIYSIKRAIFQYTTSKNNESCHCIMGQYTRLNPSCLCTRVNIWLEKNIWIFYSFAYLSVSCEIVYFERLWDGLSCFSHTQHTTQNSFTRKQQRVVIVIYPKSGQQNPSVHVSPSPCLLILSNNNATFIYVLWQQFPGVISLL